jgi:hypothetical protein
MSFRGPKALKDRVINRTLRYTTNVNGSQRPITE